MGKNLFNPEAFFEFYQTSPIISESYRMQRVSFEDRECFYYQARAGRDSSSAPIIFPMTFKENTQYTISFESKQVTGIGNSATGLGLKYAEGALSCFANPSGEWEKNVGTSVAGRTVIGVFLPWNQDGGIYVDINTIQIEEGTIATEYEPYDPVVTPLPDLSAEDMVKYYLLGQAVRISLLTEEDKFSDKWKLVYENRITTKYEPGSPNGYRNRQTLNDVLFPFSEGDIVRLTVDGMSAKFVPIITYRTDKPEIEMSAKFGNPYFYNGDEADTGYNYSVIWWREYGSGGIIGPWDYSDLWFHSRNEGTFNVKIERWVG